jgi:hypothetical protein
MTHDPARQLERRATRMSEMMTRQRVDVGNLVRVASGDAYQQARLRCLKCSANQECLLWLDANPRALIAPDFCPNLPLFRSYRARR